MEALDAMSKTNKSYYRWHGLEGLPKLMADLQKEAVEERLPERVLRVEQAMCSFTELSPGSRKAGTKEIVGTLIGEDDAPSSSNLSCDHNNSFQSSEKRSRVDGRDRQGRNSLAQLCRRFLMKNTRRVSLDVASTVLIKDPETEGFEPPSRSRCRRLYDIANVLVALGLIKKPVWTPAAFPDFMRSPLGLPRASGPLIPQPINKVPVVQTPKPAVKHTVTNILGVSNKVNIDPLNHRNSSPFQVVRKDNSTRRKIALRAARALLAQRRRHDQNLLFAGLIFALLMETKKFLGDVVFPTRNYRKNKHRTCETNKKFARVDEEDDGC
ncbi:transcription factor E2F/dimerization partner [Necator americanus]|uniref:Transcription factor E2F/dimerization partner n=1 Tax=Necator americanus TaxID=51031 RepID=W2TN51_NECAM|nr:transcription factor E2F/dimerization partner [Necator americanus]ETN83198.1 transcription factor E2F/dimerization partner [Necator americanus]